MIRSIYDSGRWLTYIFILVAVLIVIATVYFSNSLSEKLAEEERTKAEILVEAFKIFTEEGLLDMPDENLFINKELKDKYEETQGALANFISNIIISNKSIPLVLYDEKNDSITSFNLSEKDSFAIQISKNPAFKIKNPPIVIKIDNDSNHYLYYDDSNLLKSLMMFPYIQLTVVFVFILLAFLALASTKRAEQNKVWVGLSKETAHQLGTPISSLIAWVEYLKLKDVDGTYLKEMEKDVKRLETIAERFSKIGSKPDLLPLDINSSLTSAYEYMSTRISSKVKFTTGLSREPALVLMNESLFSWVIENLTKNAVDAMEGQGNINYTVTSNRKKIYIDVSDTGKGITKSRYNTIFNPGYTTKARGWGLGLSLVKRIIESYPGGKIYVKSSELGKGTVFRIELRKYQG